MRIRVPVAVRNRLLRLEGRRHVDLPTGGWPPLMDLDGWEALASRMQDELITLAHEEIRSAPQPVQEAPPSSEDNVQGALQRSAIEEYLEARRRQRVASEARSIPGSRDSPAK